MKIPQALRRSTPKTNFDQMPKKHFLPWNINYSWITPCIASQTSSKNRIIHYFKCISMRLRHRKVKPSCRWRWAELLLVVADFLVTQHFSGIVVKRAPISDKGVSLPFGGNDELTKDIEHDRFVTDWRGSVHPLQFSAPNSVRSQRCGHRCLRAGSFLPRLGKTSIAPTRTSAKAFFSTRSRGSRSPSSYLLSVPTFRPWLCRRTALADTAGRVGSRRRLAGRHRRRLGRGSRPRAPLAPAHDAPA